MAGRASLSYFLMAQLLASATLLQVIGAAPPTGNLDRPRAVHPLLLEDILEDILEDQLMRQASLGHRSSDEISEGLYQGDMMLTEHQRRELLLRNVMADSSYWWPRDTTTGDVNINYRFGDSIVSRSGVKASLNAWQDTTCLRFHEITASDGAPHFNFLNSTSCNSYVGRIATMTDGQVINLTPGCADSLGTTAHEIGHALGLRHQQSRSDRDNYVYIMTGNVEPGMEHNFLKEDTNNFGLPYDYTSIMHYGAQYFSVNDLDTVVTKDPLAQPLIGQRGPPSFIDKKIVNLQYKCNEKWLSGCSVTTDPCQNMGYLGADCTCRCPAGTSGTKCESLDKPYIDALVANMTPNSLRCHEGCTSVTSPGYPTPYTTKDQYVQEIVAPLCKRVVLTFNQVSLQNRTACCGCYWGGIEIRTADPPITGTWYCGSEMSNGAVFRSVGRTLVLNFKGAGQLASSYSATVTYEPLTTPECDANSTSAPTATSTTLSSTSSATPTTTSSTITPSTTSSATPTTTSSTITPSTTSAATPTTTSAATPTTTSAATPTTTSATTPSTTAPRPTITNSGLLPLLVDALGACILAPLSARTTRYNSPNFPAQYGPGQTCRTWFKTSEPRYLIVTPVILNLGAGDQLSMSAVYQNTTNLVNSMVNRPFTVPSSSFFINFKAGNPVQGRNFAFKIEEVNTDCHQIIDLMVGASGELFIPPVYPANTVCEWWIRAPAGKKVQVKFTRFFIGGSTCKRDYVLIDVKGDPKYSAATSRYCGGDIYSPGTVTSTSNVINVLVSGQYGGYNGLNATYSVV